MSKYIDERPFEEVIRTTIIDENNQEYIETILHIVQNDESTGWKTNTFRGDSTMYEHEVFHLKAKRKQIQTEFDQIEKHYTSVLGKVAELSKELNPNEYDEEDEYDEEEDEYEEDYSTEKGKGSFIKAKPAQLKPSDVATKRRQNEFAYQNFKHTLATLQEELRTAMTEMKKIDAEIKRNEYYHDISVKSLRTLRRLVNHYKEHKDVEFLKKGVSFTKTYSDLLWNRYQEDF